MGIFTATSKSVNQSQCSEKKMESQLISKNDEISINGICLPPHLTEGKKTVQFLGIKNTFVETARYVKVGQLLKIIMQYIYKKRINIHRLVTVLIDYSKML